MIEADAAIVSEYWAGVRELHPEFPTDVPEAWGFGATIDHANSLLALVVDGTKTGTASSGWDYAHDHSPLPQQGEFSILLDGSGTPRAVIETVDVRIVPFNEVSDEHAFAEGEDDRTLASWRTIHERFWREHSENPRGFAPDMPVVCERFELRYSSA